jgi:hypothetical protein
MWAFNDSLSNSLPQEEVAGSASASTGLQSAPLALPVNDTFEVWPIKTAV